MSELVFHKRVSRYYKRLPKDKKKNLLAKLKELAADPENYPGVVTMSGDWVGFKRIRVGNLRAIFMHKEEEEIIYIAHLGPRGDIYKK